MPRRSKSVELRAAIKQHFGNACQRCGYNRCLRALQFHHRNGRNGGPSGHVDLDELVAHPDLFELLCSNCHFEEHERLDEAKRLYATCVVCGKTFPTTKSRIESGRDETCSRKCGSTHRRNRVTEMGATAARFWKKVDKSGDCWMWLAEVNPKDGRGRFIINKGGKWSPVLADNFAYELVHGHPPKFRSPKSCGVDRCVNPDHRVDPVRKGSTPPRTI